MKKFNLTNIYNLNVQNKLNDVNDKTIKILNYAYALNSSPLRWLTDKALNKLKAVQ